jgi:hypothetical protein
MPGGRARRRLATVARDRLGAVRWKFLDPDRPEEASRRAGVLAAIDEFWAGFAGQRDAVEGGADRALAWMADHLRRVDEQLAWEIGPAAAGGRSMTITPESRRELRPLVATVLERAPHVPGWTFTGHRPPVPAEHLAGVVQSRVDADLAGWSARLIRRYAAVSCPPR